MAQNNQIPTLRVELKCENCGLRPEYTLELSDPRSHQNIASAELAADDTFTLHDVPYGDYQLAVLDAGGETVYQESFTVGQVNMPEMIRIQAPAVQKPPTGGVSVTQLQHPPTKKAYEAALAAQKFTQAGNYARAAEELEKAVRLSPYFADAYTNLGVQYMRLHRYADAEAQLERALKIGGPVPLVLTNLAANQLSLKRRGDAIQSARAALRVDPEYAQAHLVLGMALAGDTRTVHEGIEHLKKAAQTIPGAQGEIEKVRQAMTQAGM